MLECSWLVGQLPSGLSAWPVLLTRAGTSSRVAGVAGRVGSVGVSMGRMPGCHGGPSRAGRGGSAFATRARCVDGGTGWSSPSVALLRHWAADHWSHGSTGFWRQFGSSAQDDKHIGAGARRGAGLRDLAYRVSKLFSQHCVRLVALRKPVLWTARAARRPFLFWIGLRARSGCAGPLGPRPLAPPRLCTPRRASGMMAASRGPSGPLRGSPLPRGHTAGWFGTTQPVEGQHEGRTRRGGTRTPNRRAARGGASSRRTGGYELTVGPYWLFGAKWIISGRQREFDADGRPTSQMHSYGIVCNLCIG